jgi:hypothetical protein
MAVSGAFRFGRGREGERATKREGGSFSSRQVKFNREQGSCERGEADKLAGVISLAAIGKGCEESGV